jgi:hypothetical protein
MFPNNSKLIIDQTYISAQKSNDQKAQKQQQIAADILKSVTANQLKQRRN